MRTLIHPPSARGPLLPRLRRPRLHRWFMAWCKAFAPIDASPPCRPDPPPSARRAHARSRATPGRSSFRTNDFNPRTFEPSATAAYQSSVQTNPPLARPNPRSSRQRLTARTPGHERTQPSDATNRTRPPSLTKIHNRFPAAHTRTRPTLPPSLRSGFLPARPLVHHPRLCPKAVTRP